jgi:hypothetical protein
MAPPDVRTEELPPPFARDFPSRWQKERARILQRAFSYIESQAARGVAVTTAARRFSARWTGRTYQADETKRLQLSRHHLLGIFYRYIRSGRSSEVLALHYKSSGKKILPELIAGFLEWCDSSGVVSMAQARRHLRDAGIQMGEIDPSQRFPSMDAFARALSVAQRRSIADLHRAQRQLLSARKRFQRVNLPRGT